MSWFDLVPVEIAILQVAWERRHRVYFAVKSGVKPKVIAKHLKICPSRISQMCVRARRDEGKLSPVEKYLKQSPLYVKSNWHQS